MANVERPEGQQPAADEQSKPDVGLAIIAMPFAGERAQIRHTPDGGFTVFLRGEIQIAYRPPVSEAAESLVASSERQPGSLIPESTQSPVREPHSAADDASPTASQPRESEETAEQENRKFELVGNPVRDPSYRERKSGKRIADFVLATHDDAESTQYWRIRAFDKQAEKVRDQVRKGQTGVETTVYGPKKWKTRKKTKEGSWEETEVAGYYAGFVKVPRKYREEKNPPAEEEQPASPEEVRQQRQEKLDQKIERMRARADRLEETADGKQADFNHLRGDIAFLTQPAGRGSAFGRQRDRIMDRYDQGLELQSQARDLRENADRLEKRGAVVKGDKERARQQQREAMDKVVEKGSKIHDPIFGSGEVIRVNKKTYRIQFERGFTTTRDKSFVQLQEDKEHQQED